MTERTQSVYKHQGPITTRLHSMDKVIFLVIASHLALNGCHSSTTIAETTANQTTNGSAAIFLVSQSGGCVRIGPNCAQHSLYGNGNVEVKRNGSEEVQAQGTIDTGQVSSWLDLVASTDFDALKTRLPEGSCSGCVDGIDYIYTIQADGNTIRFDSIETRFDQAEPFFAMTQGLYAAMQNAAPLEIR